MLWRQSVVLQTRTLCVAVVTASSPTWCVTTRPTVLMNPMRQTAVSTNGINEWFHLIVEQKNNFQPSLSLSQTVYSACLALAVSTWMKVSGRRPASSPRTLMMTLIGGSASRAKHLGQARTLTTVPVSTHSAPNTISAPVPGLLKMKNGTFYTQTLVLFVFDCLGVSCWILENETKCPSRNYDTSLLKIGAAN